MDNLAYEKAKNRVKKLKSFYKHATAFVVVNLLIVYFNFRELAPNESYFQYKNFVTFFFWGIGLLAHAATLFLPGMLLGKQWEDQKIKQLMDQEYKKK